MNYKLFSALVLSIFLLGMASATIAVDGYFQDNIYQKEATITNGGSITLHVIFTSTNLPIINMEVNVPSGLSSVENSCTLSESGHTYFCEYTITSSNTGTFEIGLTGRDSSGSIDSDYLTLTVTSTSNQNPVLALIGDKTINEGSLLSFDVSATDPDYDTLTFSHSSLPSGASFNPPTKQFSWIPTSSQAGSYSVTFTVNDNHGGTDSEEITITVNDVPSGNHNPEITSSPVTSVIEGNNYYYDVDATDEDDDDEDNLEYSLIGDSPGWLSINTNTGEITGTAHLVSSTEYYTVTVKVSDSHSGTDEQTYILKIKNYSSGSSSGSSRTISDSDIYYQNKYFDQFNSDKVAYTEKPAKNYSLVWVLFYILIGLISLGIIIVAFLLGKNLRR